MLVTANAVCPSTLLCGQILHYNLDVPSLSKPLPLFRFALLLFLFVTQGVLPQSPPPTSGARILLLPRKLVSGERATLAVLDVNGRLTPGATVEFTNGDKLTTDATGRALFVAPLNIGKIFAAIQGRPGRVSSVILSAAESPSATQEVSQVPRVASLSDRFEIMGHGFCGDADANHVTIGGFPALVLASSPAYLAVLPPEEMHPGPAQVQVSCGQKNAAPFTVNFVTLELEVSTTPLAPREHRTVTVRVRGSNLTVNLEARNLAPDVAELQGGTPVRRTLSSGGTDNTAKFELIGKQRGSFVISIRLVSPAGAPRPLTQPKQ